MGWQDLLQKKGDETIVAPWVGGRTLQLGPRTWAIDPPLPREHGWYTFKVGGGGRKVKMEPGTVEAAPGVFREHLRGYLVGDWLVPDDARVDPDPTKLADYAKHVLLVEPGLERFVRIQAGRLHEGGPLIFEGQEMPLGPEEEVLQAFYDQKESVAHVKGVMPALDAAFRMEAWRRAEAVARRAEIERLRKEEEARLALEERRAAILKQLGDGAGRRAMAAVDFAEAARAALAVSGAEYLDHRVSPRKGEMVVRFRFLRRQFECTCEATTLRIIDSGICLIDHATNVKGDNRFTLESLPGVIAQADRERRLVVFRHVGDDRNHHDDRDDEEDWDD